MFKLNDHLTIAIKGKAVTGKLIGIDCYRMENFEGRKIGWTSYTLTSDAKGVFGRYWLSDRGSKGWFVSIDTKQRKSLTGCKIALERSGLAQIEFTGDKGPSTPAAALLAHQLPNGDYYTIERFLGSAIMFFHGQKIQKPKILR